MIPRSITRRVSASFAALLAVVLTLLGGYLYQALGEHFLERDTVDLIGKITQLRRILSEFRSEDDVSLSARRFQDALVGHYGLYLSIWNVEGRVLVSSADLQVPGNAWGEPLGVEFVPRTVRTWSPTPDRQYRVVSAFGRLGQQPEKRVLIFLAYDVSYNFEILRNYRQTLIVALAISLAATTLLGWWITRRELRPVRSMAATAHSISASRLAERLDLAEIPVELRRLGEAFNTMLARLQESFARLSDFSSDLAHELRTPIQNLMTHSQVALNKARAAHEYRKVLEANTEEMERIARMVEDMLFLARADKAQAVLKKERFHLREEVDKVGAYFEPLAEERRVRIECEGDAEVRADRMLVERVTSNLLSNAVRHADPGSRIRVSLGTTGACARLEVANSGPGIPVELQARVFDRFFQVSPSRSWGRAGSGLGLAIVKSIMELHDGSVSVASSPEGPTSFTASFPL